MISASPGARPDVRPDARPGVLSGSLTLFGSAPLANNGSLAAS